MLHLSAMSYSTIFVSAGRRGLELELSPRDLADLTGASLAEICQSGVGGNGVFPTGAEEYSCIDGSF